MTNKIEKNDPKNASDNFDHLIYLRVFEGCNLHCEHCFIPSNPKKMTLDKIRDIKSYVSAFAKKGDTILIQWHGGEPTAVGAKWFRKAIDIVIESLSDYDVVHGIQTNLIKYDDSWKSIYQDYFDSNIGVSWDPEIRLMKKGKPETNSDYEKIFWEKIKALQNDGIEPYLVITGTRIFFERFSNPYDLFEFLKINKIKRCHIERLTKTGYARESWDKIGINNLEYSNYMKRLSRAYFVYSKMPAENDFKASISPFDGINESVDRLINGESGGYGCLSGSCDTNFHTFDANGYKKGCTALNSEYDNSKVIMKDNGVQVLEFSDFSSIRKERQLDCNTCKFNTICSSGCLASDKTDISGECSGGFQLFESILNLKNKQLPV
jgi:radical SAM protein with 4Fe4S-binding SPASM domain